MSRARKSPSVIRQRGLEDRVIDYAALGLSTREIRDRLEAEGHGGISHSAVHRFLRAEQSAREAERRAVGASAAAVITAQAGRASQDYVAKLSDVADVMHAMAVHGYRTLRVPGEEPRHEKVGAKVQVEAAGALKATAGYLIELAGANPPVPDAADKRQVAAVIAEVFGYRVKDPAPREVPSEGPDDSGPTDDEHQPPVVH
jgi:hypothetical protein